MNTKTTGKISFLTAKPSDSDYYVGFCYELAIVMENKNADQLVNDLYEAAKGYIRVCRENNLNDKLLDKHDLLPKDLQELYAIVKESLNDDGKSANRKKAPREYVETLSRGGAQLSVACV